MTGKCKRESAHNLVSPLTLLISNPSTPMTLNNLTVMVMPRLLAAVWAA